MKKIITILALLSCHIAHGDIPFIHLDNRSTTEFFIPELNITIASGSQQNLPHPTRTPLAFDPFTLTLQSVNTQEIHSFTITTQFIHPFFRPIIPKPPKFQLTISYDNAPVTSKELSDAALLVIIFDEDDPYTHEKTLYCPPYTMHIYMMNNKVSYNVLATE